jgi:hypothetical protein
MAYSSSVWPGFVLPLIDAKQNNFFTALYRGGRRISDPVDAGVSRIVDMAAGALSEAPAGEGRLLLTGPDAALFYRRLDKGRLPEDSICIDPGNRRGWAGDLLELVKKTDIFNNGSDGLFTGPEYIRKSDAELQIQSPAHL